MAITAARMHREPGRDPRRINFPRLYNSGPHGPDSASPSGSAPPAASFAAIVEPFDPGHPARARSGGGDCGAQATTTAIVACYLVATENVDARIDAARQPQVAATLPPSRRSNAGDALWLH